MRSLTKWRHAPSDRAGRDWPTIRQRGGIVEVQALVVQVVGGAVGLAARVGVESETGGFAADRGGNDAGFTLQHGERFLVHPGLGGGVALR